MIPSVFISSTIRDLHYLRDAIRESVEDLHYNPVMSDYGEVGYIAPSTASSLCYRSIEQCQIFVLIIGRRYNASQSDGLSVTHVEYRTARAHGIPIITFIERDVLHFKEVFDVNAGAKPSMQFPQMDSHEQTFRWIDEIRSASSYSGIIPFSNTGDAKRQFKLQLADLVGQKLIETSGPLRLGFEEILSELKTLRHDTQKKSDSDSKTFLAAIRFLLTESSRSYRSFIEMLTNDVDGAIPDLAKTASLSDFLAKLGIEVRSIASRDEFKKLREPRDGKDVPYSSGERLIGWRNNPRESQERGFYVYLHEPKVLYTNEANMRDLEATHTQFLKSLTWSGPFFGQEILR